MQIEKCVFEAFERLQEVESENQKLKAELNALSGGARTQSPEQSSCSEPSSGDQFVETAQNPEDCRSQAKATSEMGTAQEKAIKTDAETTGTL